MFLEAGCGNGSNVYPLLEALPRATVWAVDVSAVAIEVREGTCSMRNGLLKRGGLSNGVGGWGVGGGVWAG